MNYFVGIFGIERQQCRLVSTARIVLVHWRQGEMNIPAIFYNPQKYSKMEIAAIAIELESVDPELLHLGCQEQADAKDISSFTCSVLHFKSKNHRKNLKKN